jgi:hypothetical protein
MRESSHTGRIFRVTVVSRLLSVALLGVVITGRPGASCR